MNHSALGLSAIVAAPFGGVGVRVSEGLLVELIYLRPGIAPLDARDRVAGRVVRQIERYLQDPDFSFDLPLAPKGSAFQQRVWRAIGDIPRGQVRSYGALARQLRTAPRAVGQACGANWFPLVIPCHRVVAAQGIGGFAGSAESDGTDVFTIDIKRWLLAHEGLTLE